MSKALERINRIASKQQSKWLDEAKERVHEATWRDKSVKIAIRVLREIRKQKETNGMTQKRLAEEMGVSPQYISKVVKGQENLTLETISKLETVLGIRLFEIPLTNSLLLKSPKKQMQVIYTKKVQIAETRYGYGSTSTYFADAETNYNLNATDG